MLGDAGGLIIGFVVIVAGLSAILLFRVRRKPRAGLLLWFGSIAVLYGVRLLASTDTIRLLTGSPEMFGRYLISFINYVILIPFVLFWEGIYGKGWKSSLRVLFWIQTFYRPASWSRPATFYSISRRQPPFMRVPLIRRCSCGELQRMPSSKSRRTALRWVFARMRSTQTFRSVSCRGTESSCILME